MGLDNDAFRQFMNDGKATGSKKPKATGSKKKPSTKPGIGAKGQGKAPGKPGADAAEKDEAPKYRDRADERRRGITVEESAPSFLTAEETRYLGGTMERTHLVRGLDRLLLNQVRDKAADGSHAGTAAPEAAEDKQAEKPTDVSDPANYSTALGRTVATLLLKPLSSNVAELFQPKRMAFVYFGSEAAQAGNEGGDWDAEEGDPDDEDGGGVEGPLWKPEEAEGGLGADAVPDTLLRSKAECPEPPDAMNAAADKAVLTEVVGVLKAVRIEGKHRGKDRKRAKEDTSGALAAALEEKEQHILQLRKFENPKLVADLALRDAAAAKTKAAPSTAGAGAQQSGRATAARAAAAGGDEDSGDSGLFDDVGDDYEVDTSALKRKQKAKGDAKGMFGGDTMKDLPAVAQHGNARGNDRADPPSTSGHPQHRRPSGHPPGQGPHGAPMHGHYGGQYAYPDGAAYGYHDHHGNWVPYHSDQYQQWGPGGMPYVAATDVRPAGPAEDAAANRGKGFAAKMGDRANVKSAFTTEQRQAKVGKGFVEAAGDEYGADILLGGGGLDGDEEEDLKQMENRGRTLTRADFDTEEQYASYKASKEAAPKAAFQFGVKVQDGRRSHKDMERQSNRKIESQLRSIRDMKGDVGGRKVDFSQFDGAFGGRSKGGGDAVAPTPARKRIKL